MDALLILGGLLLVIFGLVWLVSLAFGSSLFWGIGSLVPPITLIYTLRYWRRARKAVILAGLGFIPLVVGLVQLASHDQARLEAILSLDWLKPAEAPTSELAIKLHGQLNGQPFAPQQAELIDGVLTLREGEDFFARREVSIHLSPPVSGPLLLDVLPNDGGILPEVEISWLEPEQDLPEARRLNRGYTLHVDLKPSGPNRLAGDFHLVLPAQFNTALSGSIELYTNHLRYRDGKVDARVDSRDTLFYVVEDYLQRRYASPTVQVRNLSQVSFPASSLELSVDALVNGRPEQLVLLLSKTEPRGWSVQGDQFARLPLVPEQPAAPVQNSTSKPEVPRSTLDRRLHFSLKRLQRSPDQYLNLRVQVVTERGSTAQGLFTGINADGRIVIRRDLNAPGEASYILRPDEISQIELLEP